MAASRPFADGRHLTASEQINDGKHQRLAGISTTTQGRRLDRSPARGISITCVRGQSSRPLPWGGISTTHWGRHLNHTLGEASRSLTGERHFAASEQIDDGKHQPIAGRLDHSPMGGISQRQSESMTGSIDLLSASRSLKARGISIARRREAFHSATSGGKLRPIVGISTAHRREAFHSPCGGKHQRVAGSSSMFFLLVLFLFCVCGCAWVCAGDAECL